MPLLSSIQGLVLCRIVLEYIVYACTCIYNTYIIAERIKYFNRFRNLFLTSERTWLITLIIP